MRFRRNVEMERLFKWIGIFSAIAFVVLFIVFLLTFNSTIFRFVSTLFPLPIISYFVVMLMKKQFIEFDSNKIRFIANERSIVEFNVDEVLMIVVPSNEVKGAKDIIIRRSGVTNITSYNEELKKYLENNFNSIIKYYDKYSDGIKMANGVN